MNKNNLTKELVTRTNQFSFYKYIGILPNPDKLFTRYGTYKAYRDLKSDTHLWACIQSRKAGVLSHMYNIQQGKTNDYIFNFISDNFQKLDIDKLISQILDAILMGFQVFEIFWEQVNFKNNLLYSIKDIDARPQEYFFFDLRGELHLKNKSFNSMQKSKKIPLYKTLLVQYEADYDNPYGQSLLSKCYWVCTFKNTAMRFWVNFIEKFGLPTIIASTLNNLDDNEAQTLMDSLLKMQDLNTIVAGGGINLQLYDNNKNGNVELYRELINICNAEISKVILSQTLTTEIQTGSYAAAKTHFDVRNDVVESDLEFVEKHINLLLEQTCELNFGKNAIIPVFKFEK